MQHCSCLLLDLFTAQKQARVQKIGQRATPTNYKYKVLYT